MPKIIGGSLHEHRVRTRQRLFASLSDLMTERGFEAITLAEIAATAGIGRTAVYNHFTDKESLLLEFIAHETRLYVESLEDALAGVTDPVAQLRTYVRQQTRLNKACQLASGADLRPLLSRGTRPKLREHAVGVEGVLRRILLGGIESGAFADQDLDTTVSLVHACLSGRGVPSDGAARDHALAATEAFVLRAVGTRAPALV